VTLLPAVRRIPQSVAVARNEPLRNGTNRQGERRFSDLRCLFSGFSAGGGGGLVDEPRGNLGVVYAKPSARRRRVFEGLQKVVRVVLLGRRSADTRENRRWEKEKLEVC
jgi:hypothetical protein